MLMLLYTLGLMISILLIGLTSAVLFQHTQSSFQLAAQFSGLLLSGFAAVYCTIRLIYRAYLLLTQPRYPRSVPPLKPPLYDGYRPAVPFVAPLRQPDLPQSQFARALRARHNLSYDENQQQNQRHGQQMVNRLRTGRSQHQINFERWPTEHEPGYRGQQPNRFKRL